MKLLATIISIVALMILVLVSGCNETQKVDKVYGKGDLPTGYQEYFGGDNMARLNYMQNGELSRIGQAVAELAERVRKLEVVEVANPNGGAQ